jgi:N2-methylguanosine tRNA methyltransferase (EC 2.1.1.-)
VGTDTLMRAPPPVPDVYVLELAGTDDAFAAGEARRVLDDVRVFAPGLAVASTVAGLERLAFTHRASERLTQADATVRQACAALAAATIDRRPTTAAVRAVDVRATADIDTQHAERALGDVLVECGFTIELEEPAHELRALFAGDQAVLGWRVGTTPRGYEQRQPTDRPFFQPGSMDPMLARAVTNMAGVAPGDRFIDPMCGTGGILLEAARVGARPVGLDVQPKMVQGTRENLARVVDDPTVLRGDAGRLPLVTDAVTSVAFDTPYGRQSHIAGDLTQLVADTLSEARRVADRGVVVGDQSWRAPATAAGWTVTDTFERRVHQSLTRYVLVLR